MSIAPKLLTEYIATESIVPVESRPVKLLPASIPCPSCVCNSKTGFTLYKDPSTDTKDSVWGFCTRCGLAGDLVDLYREKTGAATFRDAVKELADKGHVSADVSTTEKLCFDYEMLRQVRTNTEDFWELARTQFTNLPMMHPIIATLGLEDNSSLLMLGSATAYQVSEALGGVKLRTNKDVLIVPLHDVPGRISLFRVYYIRGDTIAYKDYLVPYQTSNGLFMLSSVKPHCDLTLAVDDPLFAFQIQNYCMSTGSQPWPVVSYTKDDTDWSAVVTSKLVFWAQEYNLELFKVASCAPNAMVSLSSAVLNRVQYMRKISKKQWTSEILMRATPWIDALASWLCRIRSEDASYALRSLNLNATQRQDLITVSTDDESADKLKNLVTDNLYARAFYFDGSEIIERGGRWYASQNSKEVFVSDTLIRLEGTVSVYEDGNYYVGTLIRRNRKHQFYLPMNTLDRELRKWIENFCLAHNMGCPEFGPGYGPRLIAIARAFSGELTNEVFEAKVGWSKDLTTFRLPKRLIKDGTIVNEVGVPVDSYPCQNVTGARLSATSIKQLLENSLSNAQFWATFACVMMNTAASYFGIKKRKIGIVGQGGFARSFASTMELPAVTITKNTYTSQRMKHDIPTNIVIDNVKLADVVKWMNEPTEKNMITDLSYLEAVQVSSAGWVFVHAKEYENYVNVAAAYDLIPQTIKLIQSGDLKLSVYTPDVFLHMLKQTLCDTLLRGEQVDLSVMDEALKLISIDAPMGTTYAQALLYGIFMIAQEGKVSIGRRIRAGVTMANSVVIDAGRVVIPKALVNKIVLDGCTQRVGQSLMEEPAAFKADYSAWTISMQYWDDTFARFQEEQVF